MLPSSRRDPLRIVAIGGGSGLSSLLRGLKVYRGRRAPEQAGTAVAGVSPETLDHGIEITAVVTVTDDGGSSGRLRREFGVHPPGDIRNCMVALSEDGALLSRLFQYRFTNGRGLKGHSFGNLFLTALTELTGDFAQAVKLSSEVLASFGRIYPSTATKVILAAKLENGTTVEGETKISRSRSRIVSIGLKPSDCQPLEETLQAIAEADLICLGPGSLYTSVIPNLLVQGIPEAIRRSPARKAYFVNLMWQPGETMYYSASAHLDALHEHAGGPLVDAVIVNSRPIGPVLRRRYAARRVFPVENDLPRLEAMGVEMVQADLLARDEKVRHEPVTTAAIALALAEQGRRKRNQAEVSPRRRRRSVHS